MNKKIKNLFLAGALVLGLAGVAVSCTDYDDDINKLQQQLTEVGGTVTNLSTQVQNLQSAINAGAVITSVTATTSDGVNGWIFKLSDGNTYTVLNGKNGADGAPGAAGAPGAPGANGKDGKDGKWYTPNAETGCWDIHEIVDGEEVVTPTTDSYLPKGQTNVKYDAENNQLVITDGDETFKVALGVTGEQSLVFIPQIYVDGVEGFRAMSLMYYPLEGQKLDSKDEIWDYIAEEEDDFVRYSPATKVQYHVNASNIELDETFDYEFIVKPNVPYYKTRGMASEDFNVIPTFNSYADGILTLDVEVVGYEAYWNYISVVALKATKDDISIVSDYATLFTGEIYNLKIADPIAVSTECKNIEDEHYRKGTVGIANPDSEDAYIPDKPAWTEGDDELEDIQATCDTVVAYDDELDLTGITAVHYAMWDGDQNDYVTAGLQKASSCLEMDEEMMAEYGLHFEYELVLNYKIGKPVTPQDEFVEAELIPDGIFRPKVYTIGQSVASIGRTPIVRVKLMHGEDIVQVAYIKVYIAETATTHAQFEMIPRRDALDDGENVFHFSCEVDSLMTTVKDMNEILYDGVKMKKYDFHKVYDSLKVVPTEGAVGTAEDFVVSQGEGTHVVVWKLTADELWDNAGKDVFIVVRYYDSEKPESNYVDIKLTATVEGYNKNLTLVKAEGDYIANYWVPNSEITKAPYGDDVTATRYNVNVPADKDTNPENCQFQNDINASFVTVKTGANAGKLDVTGVDSVAYFFCKKDVEAITTIGDLNVKFTVSEAGDSLFASILDDAGTVVVGDSLVAWIVNEPTMKGQQKIWNMFNYVKGSTVADTLLNTDAMYTYISGTAYLCSANEDVETKELEMLFDGGDGPKDHFEADILQPVYVSAKSNGKFIDGVDFGTAGSYIKIEDLLDPYDWRGTPAYKFEPKHKNYWDYYGPFEVIIDAAGAECDLDGVRQAVPATIILTQTAPGATSVVDPGSPDGTTVTLPANTSGYLTYRNNSTNVAAFNLFVKAKVKYGFGYIDTDWITIPVETTEGQGE